MSGLRSYYKFTVFHNLSLYLHFKMNLYYAYFTLNYLQIIGGSKSRSFLRSLIDGALSFVFRRR
jgi:hypothetical protein